MLRIVFLGTSAAIPSAKRNLSSIAIQKDGLVYLLDCGEGTQRQMMRFGVSYEKVSAIFLTHLHLDHVLGIFGLLETRKLKGRADKVKIFGPPGTKRALCGEAGEREGAEITELREPGKIFEGKDFSVSAFNSNHGLKYSFGYVFRENERIKFHAEKAHALGLKGKMFSEIQVKGKLKIGSKAVSLKDISYAVPGKCVVYTGDTKPIQNIAKIAKNADLLIHEATYCSGNGEEDFDRKALLRHHSTAKQAAQSAKKAKAKLLAITHISSRHPDGKVPEGEAKKIFPHSLCAKDGLELNL